MTTWEYIQPKIKALEKGVFNYTLSNMRRSNLEVILNEIDAQEITDMRQVAYIMATVWNECRLLSIPEIRAKEGTEVWKAQERYWKDGFYGRGFCQLTFKENYAKFSPVVGMDLVAEPDLVLLPKIGAKILVVGMKQGMFTGKKLDQFFFDGTAGWYHARSIVNGIRSQLGQAQAKAVAKFAQSIYDIIQHPPL